MSAANPGASADTPRRRAETLLGLYPGIEEDELAELLHWFHSEASALDVGLIASDPALAAAYRRLKSDHLDRLNGADLVRAVIVLMLIGAGILAIVFWHTA